MLKNRNLLIMSIMFLVLLISPSYKAQGFIENTGYFNCLLAPEVRSIPLNFNILTLIGLISIITFLGGKLAQRLGFPQIIGFIVTGLLFGPSFLDIVPLELSGELVFISEIALGLISFDIGSHLRVDELRKLG